jgi:hypothetical protein
MFQFPQFPLPALCIQTGVTPHDGCRVSPFGHPRIKVRSATPRGFSQPPTSFIGSRRQGIHRWPFVAWNLQRCSCSLCSSQGAKARKSSRRAPATADRLEADGREAVVANAKKRLREKALPQNGIENDEPVRDRQGDTRSATWSEPDDDRVTSAPTKSPSRPNRPRWPACSRAMASVSRKRSSLERR